MPILAIPARVAERAFTQHTPGYNGCLLSTYSMVNSSKGSRQYAQIGWQDEDGKRHGTTAHRAAWVHAHGQILDDMTVDHRPECDGRCVNVDHLRLLSNFDNARRTSGRDWPLGQCVNGHSDEYLTTTPHRGRMMRVCKECRAQRQRDYRARKRAASCQ